jgi:hypothetical protein
MLVKNSHILALIIGSSTFFCVYILILILFDRRAKRRLEEAMTYVRRRLQKSKV